MVRQTKLRIFYKRTGRPVPSACTLRRTSIKCPSQHLTPLVIIIFRMFSAHMCICALCDWGGCDWNIWMCQLSMKSERLAHNACESNNYSW